MSEACKTLEAYLAPPTQHKQRKLPAERLRQLAVRVAGPDEDVPRRGKLLAADSEATGLPAGAREEVGVDALSVGVRRQPLGGLVGDEPDDVGPPCRIDGVMTDSAAE